MADWKDDDVRWEDEDVQFDPHIGAIVVSGLQADSDVGTVSAGSPVPFIDADVLWHNEDVEWTPHIDAPDATVTLSIEDSAVIAASGAPSLAVSGVAVVVGRPRRRPAWYAPEEKKPEDKPKPIVDAVAKPQGVQSVAHVGLVVVTVSARVVPLADFGRSRVGFARASVDYTLRDQQEEEFIQLLLAA